MALRGLRVEVGTWLGLGAMLIMFTGCPHECEPPAAEIPLAAVENEPALGSFAGPLDWLQTWEQSELRITVSRDAAIGTRSCDYAHVALTYELETSDQAITGSLTESVGVDDDGVVIPQTQHLPIDALALVHAGKVPDAPGIVGRNPTATLMLEPIADGFDVTISVRSSVDQLTVALGTLSRAP